MNSKAFKRLFSYLKNHKARFIAAVLASIFGTAFTVIAPTLLGYITTTLSYGVVDGIWITTEGVAPEYVCSVFGTEVSKLVYIVMIIVTISVLYVVSFLISAFANNSFARITSLIVKDMRNDIEEKMPIGAVQSALQYVKTFQQPFSTVAGMAGQLSDAVAACERIFELLDAEEEIPDPETGAVPAKCDGTVSFEHVQFGYSPDRLLMTDVNIDVKPGQKIAIVGPTGAGKTTLINLLMRFYEIDGGKIIIDGVNSTDMTRHELRTHFGMVLQDTWLFEGTIRDNLKYGAQREVSDEEMIEAAKSVCADSFIRTMPGGYDMMLTKGAENISQGQRQLLTIARAIIADPEIMILDEATSNVDAHTEQAIQNAMAVLMKGRTNFVIAHRLSTIRDADVILYMENGDIKEVGDHDALMEQNGKYALLYNSQFA